MEVCHIDNIKCNSAAVADVNYKKSQYINNHLSIPYTSKIYNNNTTNNNNQNTPPAVKIFDQSAKALGMSSKQSVTNGKAAQLAK